MGAAIFPFEKETNKRIKSLEEESNRRFEALEQEIRSVYTLQCIQEPIVAGAVVALKEWTGMVRVMIAYDSKVDPFTDDGLFTKIQGRANIALIATTTDGDVFGGFYSVAVTWQDVHFSDPTIFAFSFESHGRCKSPKKFAVKKRGKAGVRFLKDNSYGFVWFGVDGCGFSLGNERTDSFCCDMSRAFEGLEDTTLSGMNGTNDKGPYHNCTRLVAIQLS